MSRSLAQRTDWNGLSTTPDESVAPRRFHVTHPFHPLVGKEFKLVTHRHNWGEDRVYYHDGDGELRSLPASWTDVFPADPFVFVAAGRSCFRLEDLRELEDLVMRLRS